MPGIILTDTRDRKLAGFGVRVLSSGRKRLFVHCRHRGERVWKVVGDAGAQRPRRGPAAFPGVNRH